MSSEPSKEPSRFVLVLKWGGCFTASLFAVGGFLLDLASPGDVYETLSRGSWVIVAISMGVGFTGVILDRSDEQPKS
jgi:hypothetical protein